MHKVAAAHVNQMASLASSRLVHTMEVTSTGLAAISGRPEWLAAATAAMSWPTAAAAAFSLQGDHATLIFLTNPPVRGVVESAAAVAQLTKTAETSLAVVVAVMVYCNWIGMVMLVAALLL